MCQLTRPCHTAPAHRGWQSDADLLPSRRVASRLLRESPRSSRPRDVARHPVTPRLISRPQSTTAQIQAGVFDCYKVGKVFFEKLLKTTLQTSLPPTAYFWRLCIFTTSWRYLNSIIIYLYLSTTVCHVQFTCEII